MDDYLIIACAILTLIIIWFIAFRLDKFDAQRQAEVIVQKGPAIFTKGTYSDFKAAVPNTDPVEYRSAKKLYQQGNLNVPTMAAALTA